MQYVSPITKDNNIVNKKYVDENISAVNSEIEKDIENIQSQLGNLADLETTSKDNLVGAINEVMSNIPDLSEVTSQIGDLENLVTEDKTNLVNAINEVCLTIDGIPVDLTGIYNTQVIGYDEASGKLVPMINVARTETVIPNYLTPPPWEIDVETMPDVTTIDSSTKIQVVIKGDITSDEIKFVVTSTKPYLISEFTQTEFYTYLTYIPTYTQFFELSKSPDFDTIDASFTPSSNTTITLNIKELIGSYYWRWRFEGTINTEHNSRTISLNTLRFK